MNVSALPPKMQKVFAKPPRQWNKKLKKASDTDLETVVQEILQQAEKQDYAYWNFAHKTLAELQIRASAKVRNEELGEYRNSFKLKTGNCVAFPYYSIEIAGISKKMITPHSTSESLIHPYPKSRVLKKVLVDWQESTLQIDLRDYIDNFVSD